MSLEIISETLLRSLQQEQATIIRTIISQIDQPLDTAESGTAISRLIIMNPRLVPSCLLIGEETTPVERAEQVISRPDLLKDRQALLSGLPDEILMTNVVLEDAVIVHGKVLRLPGGGVFSTESSVSRSSLKGLQPR
jgi:hypothetical protein